MSKTIEFALRTLLLGVRATMVMDLWALLLRQFGIASLNFAFLGRWIGHLPEGRWMHESIAEALTTCFSHHRQNGAVRMDARVHIFTGTRP